MSLDEMLPRALSGAAGALPGDLGDWAAVRERALRRRWRRRAGQGVGLVALAAFLAGVVLATGRSQNQPAVESTPPMPASVVAAIGSRLVVLSANDGHVERTLVSAPDGRPLVGLGLAVSRKTGSVYYTIGGQCGARPEIWRVPIGGGTPHKVVSVGAGPSVSPDGRYLAYSTGEVLSNPCLAFDVLVVRDLRTGKEENAQLGGPYAISTQSWWPDSRRLEIANGPDSDTVRVAPDGIRELRQIHQRGNGYGFLPTGEPITAVPTTTGTRIITFDPNTGSERRTVTELDQTLFLIDVDTSGSSFLLGGPLGESSSGSSLYRAHVGNPQPIKLVSNAGTAAWLPTNAAKPTPPRAHP
jgi:hypothetical protein